MERSLLLILSLWLSLNVAIANEARSLEELMDLISTEPKFKLNPDETYEALIELNKNYSESQQLKRFIADKPPLDSLLKLNDEKLYENKEDSFKLPHFNKELMKWLPNRNVADYIYDKFARYAYIQEGEPKFVRKYKKLRDKEEAQSMSVIKQKELNTILFDDSAMDPDQTYQLLKQLSELMTFWDDKPIIYNLESLGDLAADFDCESKSLINEQYLNHSLLKVPKISAYLKFFIKMKQEDCKFKLMSIDERLGLPLMDELDCERIFDEGRVRLGYKEMFDISRTLNDDVFKCPGLEDREVLFDVVAKISTCSKRDCCEVLRSVPEDYYGKEYEFSRFIDYYDQNQARISCFTWIEREVEGESLFLKDYVQQIKHKMDWANRDALNKEISKLVNLKSKESISQQKIDILEKMFKKSCEMIRERLSSTFRPYSSLISTGLTSKTKTPLAEHWLLWRQCNKKMYIIEELIDLEGCNVASRFIKRCLWYTNDNVFVE